MKKWAVIIVFLLTAALLLCACGTTEEPASGSGTPSAGESGPGAGETAGTGTGNGWFDPGETELSGETAQTGDPAATGDSSGEASPPGQGTVRPGGSQTGRVTAGDGGTGVSNSPSRQTGGPAGGEDSQSGGTSAASQAAGSTTRRVSRTTKTPPREDAQSLLPATGSSAASLNVTRIRYCLMNYGFCYLAPGEVFELSEPLQLSMNDAVLGCADKNDPAELRLVSKAWQLIDVTGRNITIQDLIINYNRQYGTGTSLDKAVVQLYGPSTVIDNCRIMGGSAPESKGSNQITGVYFLYEGTGACVVKNSVIRNCFYGVLFRDVLTKSMGHTLENCTVTYNRCDGVTFAGYGTVKDCTITYNGYDCLNPVGGTSYPIPGAGVYTEGNQKGFTLDGCEIAYNNGFNLDVNRAANCTITNNNIHDPGWVSFPEALDYKTVKYRNGISACLTGLRSSTVTGNTITNSLGANRLDQSYAHLYTGGDVNGYFRVSGSAADFSDLPAGGASVVACALVNYPGEYQNYGNTISGNTFTARTSDGTTGVGLFVGRNVGYSNSSTWYGGYGNRISDNTMSQSETGSVRCGRNTWSSNSDDSLHTGDSQHNRGSSYYFYR